MATTTAAGRRGMSTITPDSRTRPSMGRTPSYNANEIRNRTASRKISVDGILQNASEIPSGQSRNPPARGLAASQRRRAEVIGPIARGAPQSAQAGRSTKTQEKLILIPENLSEKEESDDEEDNEFGQQGGEGPLKDSEAAILKKRGGVRGKSHAERLPKTQRTKEISRVTAYCTAENYALRDCATFLKEKHGAKTKLYVNCLYTVYHLPILPGSEGYRIRSSPVLKSPGGKAVLDEEIDRNERRDYHEGYFEDTDAYGVRGEEGSYNESEEARARREDEERRGREELHGQAQGVRADSPHRVAPDAKSFGEMFVFSYGVVVFWNFTERQEKDILADMAFSQHESGIPLVLRPHKEEDFEMEDLHFDYRPLAERPRILDDVITLRSGDHVIKLSMSYAIAQSTKLTYLEFIVEKTMLTTEHIPLKLAETGEVGIKRRDVFKYIGKLYKSRMDVNLSKDILDVPDFFWESEPTLHPLYAAVRDYFEINQRIKRMDDRIVSGLEMTKMMSDTIAQEKMHVITWIVIILIGVSIGITSLEAVVRFFMLAKGTTVAEYPGMHSLVNIFGNDVYHEALVQSHHHFWGPLSFESVAARSTVRVARSACVIGLALIYLASERYYRPRFYATRFPVLNKLTGNEAMKEKFA